MKKYESPAIELISLDFSTPNLTEKTSEIVGFISGMDLVGCTIPN